VVRSAGEASFAKSYSPETLPKIDLPDLPMDAVSVSAQDLAEIDDSDEEDPLSEPVQALYAPEPEAEPESDPEADAELLAAIQVMKAQADQRAEIMQARMDKLSGQISSLNDKLDRLANISRIEV
jgi:outer membrane murein-binding lipoprotein Lpp